MSNGLQELVAYYSNGLSYKEVEDLVERLSGEKILSDQKIWEIVVNKAVEISSKWEQEMVEIQQGITKDLKIAPIVDIYEARAEEILLFDDGIGVKKQKENRGKKTDIVSSEIEELEKQQTRKTVITDLVLLQTTKGSFEYLISPIDKQGQPLITLEEIIKSKLKSEYQNNQKPLPIVAITDFSVRSTVGASNIRKRLKSLSCQGITLILDWYHLCKKMREFLSMISRNKAEKNEHSKFLFFNLWYGNISGVLSYLKTKILGRNQQKLDELIN